MSTENPKEHQDNIDDQKQGGNLETKGASQTDQRQGGNLETKGASQTDQRQGGNLETKGASRVPPSGRADTSDAPERLSGRGQPPSGEE